MYKKIIIGTLGLGILFGGYSFIYSGINKNEIISAHSPILNVTSTATDISFDQSTDQKLIVPMDIQRETKNSINQTTQVNTSTSYDMANDRWAGIYDKRFYAERHDRKWSLDKETRLTKIFNSAKLNNSVLKETSCHTTLCRIYSRHADQTAEQQFISKFASDGKVRNLATPEFYYRVLGDNGEVYSVFYLSRKEYAFQRNNFL